MIIALTRYNPSTYKEYRDWCKKNNFNGSIINAPCEVNLKISPRTPIFVIHILNLNKTKLFGISGKIIGFSVIENKPVYSHNIIYNNKFNDFDIYSDKNYNRYTYVSKYFVSFDKINETKYHILRELECVIFYGKNNSKRGEGISLPSFPKDIVFTESTQKYMKEIYDEGVRIIKKN